MVCYALDAIAYAAMLSTGNANCSGRAHSMDEDQRQRSLLHSLRQDMGHAPVRWPQFMPNGEPVNAMYKTVVADPPWPYATPGQIGKTLEHRPNRDQGLSAFGAGSKARYGAMSLDEIKALSVPAVCQANAHLYLWATNAFIVQAHEVARAWGFRPITLITWTKVREDGQPSMKMGMYYRGATEHCLFGVRGSLRLRGPAASTALLTPRTTHSEKPEEFYRLVEEQSHERYLELFARRKRDGWSAWGDEVDSDVQLVA